jgi:predicted nucleotide-binding protein
MKEHQTKSNNDKSKKVYVIHGRNRKACDALFDFLRSIKLKPFEFVEAIPETGKGSPYVGEVLDKAFSIAQAIIVLMTPDDEARLREHLWGPEEQPYEKQLTPQARPNVLFEAGMAMGKFADRTIIVELGKLRPLSDIFGRHTVKLDDSIEKRQDLAKRLENSGCPISLKGTDWQKSGKFKEALQEPSLMIKSGEQSIKAEDMSSRKWEKQGSAFLPDKIDLINNDFLNKIYEQAYNEATSKYHDAKLGGFGIYIWPFFSDDRVKIYFYFNSNSAKRQCVFKFSDTNYQVEYIPPDGFIEKEETFNALPWEKSPNWLLFIKRKYAKIAPLSPVLQTNYSLLVFQIKEDRQTWILKFSDGFSGREHKFTWYGKEMDNNNE